MRGDFQEVTYGYCACGCGQQTKISPRNDKRYGWVKGESRKYLFGHHIGLGKNSPGWKGEDIP